MSSQVLECLSQHCKATRETKPSGVLSELESELRLSVILGNGVAGTNPHQGAKISPILPLLRCLLDSIFFSSKIPSPFLIGIGFLKICSTLRSCWLGSHIFSSKTFCINSAASHSADFELWLSEPTVYERSPPVKCLRRMPRPWEGPLQGALGDITKQRCLTEYGVLGTQKSNF